jgi:curli biogenesis system outer membrane secretion channel CsgG
MRTLQKLITLVLVALVALPAVAQEERTIKRKVAIGRFSNETQYAKGMFYDRENDPMRKQALDILSSKLAASNKFILLEREDLEILVEEAGDQMNKIGADYIILGAVTEFGRKTEGQQKVFSSTKTQIVEAGVSIRLVETATGLIIYSDEAKGSAEISAKKVLGFGESAGFDATLSDKAIADALSKLVDNIVAKCMDKPWKSYVLSVEDGNYVISGGASQGLAAGDKFNLYLKGKTVKNPQTGMDVELPGTKIGQMTVLSSFGDMPENEISFCSYEGEAIDVENLSNYYIMDK